MGFQFLLDDADEARMLTTVQEPPATKFNFTKMHDLLYGKGFTICPGKRGDQKTFRLSVMGDLGSQDIKRFLKELNKVLKQMGVRLNGRLAHG